MTVGERIACRRKDLRLTQDELAARVGYKSKAAISKIETNVNDITQSTIVKFAQALDTTVSYLMGWDEHADMLDRVNGIDPFILSLTGNLEEAEIIQKMTDAGDPDGAVKYYFSLPKEFKKHRNGPSLESSSRYEMVIPSDVVPEKPSAETENRYPLLTKEERYLLFSFNSLNKEGKEYIRRTLDMAKRSFPNEEEE